MFSKKPFNMSDKSVELASEFKQVSEEYTRMYTETKRESQTKF